MEKHHGPMGKIVIDWSSVLKCMTLHDVAPIFVSFVLRILWELQVGDTAGMTKTQAKWLGSGRSSQ
jgi:hypothetical protein